MLAVKTRKLIGYILVIEGRKFKLLLKGLAVCNSVWQFVSPLFSNDLMASVFFFQLQTRPFYKRIASFLQHTCITGRAYQVTLKR